MEVISEDGHQIRVNPGQTQELGRSNGLKTSDNTISRRQISFFIPTESNNQEIHLQFEVLGRNPIYVSRDNEVKIFRRFERGELGDGDMFCVSAKSPVWYTVRKFQSCSEGVRRNDLESELTESLESDHGFEGVEYLHEEGLDISRIDPVKEFGFLVEGHEFDSYPKKMIKSFRDWEWFLEDEGKDSEDDDKEGKKGKSRGRRKRKKGAENDDDEWTGESEEDKVLVDKSMKGQRPIYKTRSKNHSKDTSKRRRKSPTRANNREVDDEDEDEEDETLGGFIVDDENLEDAKEDEEEEDEELGDEDEEE
ncbi:hypothetical protein ACS0TY_012632 [Phlomoides rotata]